MKKSIYLITLILLTSCKSDGGDKKQGVLKDQILDKKQHTKEEILHRWKLDELRYEEQQMQLLKDDQNDYINFLNELDSTGVDYVSIPYGVLDSLYSSSKGWDIEWLNENYQYFEINSTQTFCVEELLLEAVYDEIMSYNENAELYYGGIRKLYIFKNGKHIQTIKNVEDAKALGSVYFGFYDFNLDGHIDFRVFLNDTYYEYYLFNPKTKKFELTKDWDYIRPNIYHKDKRQFFTIPVGTAKAGVYKLFQIDGNKLKVLKDIYYNRLGEKSGQNTIVDVN